MWCSLFWKRSAQLNFSQKTDSYCSSSHHCPGLLETKDFKGRNLKFVWKADILQVPSHCNKHILAQTIGHLASRSNPLPAPSIIHFRQRQLLFWKSNWRCNIVSYSDSVALQRFIRIFSMSFVSLSITRWLSFPLLIEARWFLIVCETIRVKFDLNYYPFINFNRNSNELDKKLF